MFKNRPFSQIWFYLVISAILFGLCVGHYFMEHVQQKPNPGLFPNQAELNMHEEMKKKKDSLK